MSALLPDPRDSEQRVRSWAESEGMDYTEAQYETLVRFLEALNEMGLPCGNIIIGCDYPTEDHLYLAIGDEVRAADPAEDGTPMVVVDGKYRVIVRIFRDGSADGRVGRQGYTKERTIHENFTVTDLKDFTDRYMGVYNIDPINP